MARAPLSDRAYTSRRYYRTNESLRKRNFTLEEIEEIIKSGDVSELRQLSRYYYRTDSLYHNNIDFLAHLPLYDTVVIPLYEEGKGSSSLITKAFYNACEFVDKLDLPNTFSRITTSWLINGVYYGILRQNGKDVTIQDLPIEYCRSRFKDFNKLNILEFNLNYFMTIVEPEARLEAVSTFPLEVQKAWKKWFNSHYKDDPWVLITAGGGGISFGFATDAIPPLISSIPTLKKLQDAIAREEKRDENELRKLLVQQMPIDKDGELVFQLEEVADIHESTANMLSALDDVDVLTTFGNTSLESLQESTAATQSADRINKYKQNAWDAVGRGEILFNPDGSSSLAYAIKKDEAMMIGYLNVYETWIKYHLNDKFARNNLTFDFEILPLTVFNRDDLQQAYFRGAQYGYSKMFAGVAMGIKQRDQLSLMNFENDILDMSIKMVPLQSSYTTSGSTINQETQKTSLSAQKTTTSQQGDNLNNTGGRPELPDEQKSEKTQANIAAAG